MTEPDPQAAELVIRGVRDGTLPPDSCANCGVQQSEERELYAICVRANRQYVDRGGGFVFGSLSGIPFLLPRAPSETIEIRDGHDLAVAVPLRVCDACWHDLDGGFAARILAFITQGLFVAGLMMIAAWFVAQVRGTEISFWYAAACFVAAIPFYAVGELLQWRWPRRTQAYLKNVPEYDALFAVYPNAELVTNKPTALLTESSADDPDH